MRKKENRKAPNKNKDWGRVALLSFIVLFVPLVLLLTNFLFEQYRLEPQPGGIHNYYGTLGDFIGGILNPTLTFFSVLLLIYTIRQNQKMITQGQDVIRQNGIELQASRKQLKETRKAQQKLAKLESKSLNRKEIEKNQLHYENELQVSRGEIDGLLSMKIICMSGSLGKSSLRDYSNTYTSIVLEGVAEDTIAITTLKKSIEKATILCKRIVSENYLIENPHKESLIAVQKSLSGIMLMNLIMLAESIRLVPNNALSQRAPTLLAELDDEYKAIINDFKKTMNETQISPYKQTLLDAQKELANS